MSACNPTSDALNIITVGKTAKKHNKSKIITIIVELRQARFGTWNGRAERENERESWVLIFKCSREISVIGLVLVGCLVDGIQA